VLGVGIKSPHKNKPQKDTENVLIPFCVYHIS